MFDADTPLAAIDLSNPTKPALAEVSGLSELFNVLLPAEGMLMDLSLSLIHISWQTASAAWGSRLRGASGTYRGRCGRWRE